MDDTRVLNLDNWQMAVLVTKIYNTYLRIRTFGQVLERCIFVILTVHYPF